MNHFIVDGGWFALRAAHSAARSGEFPSSLMVMGSILKILDEYLSFGNGSRIDGPWTIHAVFDGGRSARRLALLPEYKQRKPRPGEDEAREIVASLGPDLMHRLAEEAGALVYRADGIEADDIAGRLVQDASPGSRILLASGDKDWLQMTAWRMGVDMMLCPPHGEPRLRLCGCEQGRQTVLEKMFAGDSSDNIPGPLGGKGADMVIRALRIMRGRQWMLETPPMTAAVESIISLEHLTAQVMNWTDGVTWRRAQVERRLLDPDARRQISRNWMLIDLKVSANWQEVKSAAESPKFSRSNAPFLKLAGSPWSVLKKVSPGRKSSGGQNRII